MVLPIYASLERPTRASSRRAATSTPTAFTTFRTVTLPLSHAGVVAGTLLTFIPAAGDYVNAELLGSDTQHHDGRQRHRRASSSRCSGLPDGRRAVVHPDGVILRWSFLVHPRVGTEDLL